MSSATMKATISVDQDVAKKCPSGFIYVKSVKKSCLKDVVVPTAPASFGNDQVVSCSTSSDCPFGSCCYSDSYFYIMLFWRDENGVEHDIVEIKFHEANSTSFIYSGSEYSNPPSPPQYDVLTEMQTDVDRNSNFKITVRVPVVQYAGFGQPRSVLGNCCD